MRIYREERGKRNKLLCVQCVEDLGEINMRKRITNSFSVN